MKTKAKTHSEKDGISFLKGAFYHEQKVLENKLLLAQESVTHPGELGTIFEENFKEIFRKYFPKRYSIDSAIIIDCEGHTSQQIDLVIYDNFYSPIYLGQNGFKYIPAECVYAIFEIKPTINKEYLEYSAKKAESVRKLKRTSIPYPVPGRIAPKKEPISIQAGILAAKVDWQDGFGKSFKKLIKTFENNKKINCGLGVSGGSFDLFDKNKLIINDSNNCVIYFLLRVLKQLQLVGTVPAIDWNKYADIFKNFEKE